MLNIRLEGFPESILHKMIDIGIASNKTEAIRLALIDYNEHHDIKDIKQYEEDLLAVKKMQQIDSEIEEGKRKTLSAKEAIGEKYAKMLE